MAVDVEVNSERSRCWYTGVHPKTMKPLTIDLEVGI